MLATDIDLASKKELESLTTTLVHYKEVSGLTNRQVLIKQGRKLAIEHYKAFARDTPKQSSILENLRRREFRFGGRKGTTSTGISERARDRASERMSGFKSILARVTYADGGQIILRGVRIGKRGRRLLSKKRNAGQGAVAGDSSARFVQSLRAAGPLDKRPGDVVLNRRAVETIEESNLRRSGRGFLAASWLYRRWLAANQSTRKNDILLNQNTRSGIRFGLLGSVKLRDGVNADEQTLTLSSFVPGIEAVGHSRNRFAQAIRGLRQDIRQYLVQKQVKALRSTRRLGLSGGIRAALSA